MYRSGDPPADATTTLETPCTACGACCASYRVAFHWSETDPDLGGVTPAALTLAIDAHRVALRGTERSTPRCMALEGDVGRCVSCSIYGERPSPCRELEPCWIPPALAATPTDQCNRARLRHGLTALLLEDPALPGFTPPPLPGGTPDAVASGALDALPDTG